MLRLALITLVAAGLGAAPLAAQTGTTKGPTDETESTRVATRGANFLALPVGARAQALSGASTAIAEGVSALYWNTAAIAYEERTRIGVSLSNLYEDLDIQHVFAGFILPLGNHRFALSINSLSSGDIIRTDQEFPDGGNTQFGETFEWSATALGFHYARPITDRLGVGLAAKYITEGIPGARATFIGGDLGIHFQTGIYGTTIAAALVNLGSDGRLQGSLVERRIEQANTGERSTLWDTRRVLNVGLVTSEVELPTAFRFGIATELVGSSSSLLLPTPDHRLLTMIDISDPTDGPLSPRIGVEYSFRGLAFLRAGKRWSNEDQISYEFSHGLSFGGGVALPLPGNRRALLDYAYTDFGELQNVQAFAVEIAF